VLLGAILVEWAIGRQLQRMLAGYDKDGAYTISIANLCRIYAHNRHSASTKSTKIRPFRSG